MSISVTSTKGNTVEVSGSGETNISFTQSVSTVSVISPTLNSFVVTSKGPKGDKGDTGETGPTGPQGPAGSDGVSPAAFQTISVAGQDNVVADKSFDVLTIDAGSNVTVTTNASTDTITIASSDTNTNIYDTDGDLTGDRTIDLASNDLTFDNGGTAEVAKITSVGAAIFSKSMSINGTSAGGADLFLKESTANGTNSIRLTCPSSLSSSVQLTLPSADGTSGQAIITDGSGNLSFSSSGLLSTEEVQDIVGAMFSGNTETRISATYEDSDGTIDLVVDSIPVDLTSDGAGTIHANNVPTLNQNTSGTAAGLSSTLAVSSGGTGATSLTSNALLTGNGTSAIQAESNLTFDASTDTLQLLSTSSSFPRLELKSTANTVSGQRVVFIRDRGTGIGPNNEDTIGIIRFEGEDSNENTQAYGQIFCKINEKTDGSEEGRLHLQVASHDGELQSGIILTSGDTEDEVDVTVGNGSSSTVFISNALQATTVTSDNFKIGGHTINDVDLAGEFVDSDEHLMTSAAINDRIAAVGGGSDGWHGSTTRVKLLPRDFIADDGGRPLLIDDTNIGLGVLFLESNSSNTTYASIEIPTGFKATHVKVNGSATDAVEVFEMNINSNLATSKGTGNVGTEINITDVTSSTTNYLMINVDNASGNQIHGGYVTIAAV
jgi:hypothetical protein